MKIGKLFILLSLISPFAAAQTRNAATLASQNPALQKQEGSVLIKWGPAVRISQAEGETAKALSFEGCENAYADRYLPRYNQRVALGAGENDLTALLTNTHFEPLTDAEAALIDRRSTVLNEISVSTKVLTHKKQQYGMLSFIPIRKNASTGKYEKLVSFDIRTAGTYNAAKAAPRSTHTYATSSVLQSGSWYKISTASNGIYKITYSFLEGMGIDMATVNPQNLRLFGNGGGMLPEQNADSRIDDLAENAIFISGESDGTFDPGDYVLFYGTGPHTWSYSSTTCPQFTHKTNLYSDSAYYYLTFDLGAGKRILNQASSTVTPTDIVTTFDDYGFTENENVNLIRSGRDWYGEYFDNIASYNFSFSFPNIDVTSPAAVRATLASSYIDGISGAPNNAFYNVSCQSGSTTIGIPEITGASDDDYANIGGGCFYFNPNSASTTISVTKQTANAVGWMDYVEINVRRQLIMSGSQLLFRDSKSLGAGNIAEYHFTSNTPVEFWDITDPRNIRLQAATVTGTSYQFALPADSLRQFIAFTGSAYNTPSASGSVANQNLHAMSNKDMIIVVHPDFYDEAVQLANFHQVHDTITSVIVTPQQIYNEFSSGAQDICAIRDFVKMFYDRAATAEELPRYLLLFGDGSYDNKKRFSSNTNFIPTYQSYSSLIPTTSYVSDDFYGLLDNNEGYWAESDNDAVDIGVGRMPVKSASEAQTSIDKIIAYTKSGIPSTANNNNSSCTQVNDSPFGDWRNIICFIADDEDNNLHVRQSNELATIVDTTYNTYNIDKIYIDSYLQESTPGGNRYPDVTDAFSKRVEKGALIINYTGHGGEVGLAHERIIEVSDINKWSNINNMPLFFTATCEFSRYDDPERTSAGEYVFLNSKGGGIALFTTVRLVFASPNFYLNRDFYESAFTAVNGRMPRLGDLYTYIKNQGGGNSVNSRNFTLLGDPALQLTYPKYNISTDTVNNVPVAMLATDTIKALSFVTVSGFVRDKTGSILTGYNGVLYPTVYDKAQNITTLSNDGTAESPPFPFKLQKNILYKGKVSVTNGYYKYSFVVPKDIAYQFGVGRISTYAENGTDDASGYYENIIIGGSNDSAIADNIGPELKLYMNDNKFAFGGLTDENPDLYAILKDDNGINTVGNGIGHDVVAILDANTENSIVLNDYYQADLNSYKSGSIRYPFSDLAEGSHTLDLKVWDVYNNSSKAYTEFVVSKSAELALKHVLNYPNPFTTKTSFYFEQNQCCQSLEVELQVFTISGKLVKNISQFMYNEGYRSAAIEWDGRDDFGDKIGKGVYVYRIKVKTNDGQTAEKFEKLVILN